MKVQNFFKILRTYSKGPPPEPVQDVPKKVDLNQLVAIEKFQQKAVKVSVLGADTACGEALCALLKQNPLISHLYLFGEKAKGIAADLHDIDTRTMVCGYGEHDIDKSVKRAEIVMLMGLDRFADNKMTAVEKFVSEADRIVELVKICTMYAPKAFVCVCASPVSLILPLVSAIYRKTHWYNPCRIIGSVAFHQIKLCSLIAQHNGLDPSGVHVPIIGGPDVDCMVPLFSRATPIGTTLAEADLLTKRFKDLGKDDSPLTELTRIKYEVAPFSQAFALNNMITSIALGILGDQNAHILGFVRSNVLHSCKYIVSTLKMGPAGVYHNYGIPTLTPLELKLLEQAVLTINEREKYSQSFLETLDRSAQEKTSASCSP